MEGVDGVEIIAPVAKSPLDSMRGRGKSAGILHDRYTSSEKRRIKSKSIVILVLSEKQSPHIIGCK
jgi:hypothetical protein